MIVAAVAIELPQMAPKAAQATTAAIARPPRKRAITAAAKANRALLMPPCVCRAIERLVEDLVHRKAGDDLGVGHHGHHDDRDLELPTLTVQRGKKIKSTHVGEEEIDGDRIELPLAPSR
ncbi:MAG: hypothetical protein ABIQ87_12255 [Rubrivivax sp.]